MLLRMLLCLDSDETLQGTAGFVGRAGKLERLSIRSSPSESLTNHIEDDVGL